MAGASTPSRTCSHLPDSHLFNLRQHVGRVTSRRAARTARSAGRERGGAARHGRDQSNWCWHQFCMSCSSCCRAVANRATASLVWANRCSARTRDNTNAYRRHGNITTAAGHGCRLLPVPMYIRRTRHANGNMSCDAGRHHGDVKARLATANPFSSGLPRGCSVSAGGHGAGGRGIPVVNSMRNAPDHLQDQTTPDMAAAGAMLRRDIISGLIANRC